MELNLDVVGQTLEAPVFEYDWKACATYALGIGAGPEALAYTWERHPDFRVYPSFAVVPTQPIVMDALTRVNADYQRLVHGAQRITLHRAIPTKGVLRSTGRITEVQDKGKGAVVLIATETTDGAGEPVFDTEWTIFCRGQGGFGGPRGANPELPEAAAGAEPTFSVEMATTPVQALLYRLNGDLNPLHVDPALATKVGFERPILHGLCTYGFAVRAVVEQLCGGDSTRLRAFSARFSAAVYPGDTLTVRAVPATTAGTWLLEVNVGERTVLSHGVVELR